ncbi:putative serine/threonine-protein kinase [Trichinella nativa]|uniref:Serine/threonine-protein kinase n=1 Tax=Trichinella nativa TaxID=6335 RepID=A0A0V1LM33_9BILA|nr:putative serine/threonine-protein kinase [Trichinella sp. T6]KRZ60554.1 putative serine/threonine-protein kinase [Trichinella nativa]
MSIHSTNVMLYMSEAIRNRYVIESYVGVGNFGKIYKALDTQNGETVALKVSRRSPGSENEVQILQKFMNSGSRHCPKLFNFSKDDMYVYISMEILGVPLKTYRYKSKRKKLSTACVSLIAIQCIEALRDLHEAGYLHLDLSPANLLLGLDSDANRIFLIDFGLSKAITDDCCYFTTDHFFGTECYASISMHNLQPIGRKDDLLSLLYVLTELLTGSLPWKTVQSRTDIVKMKIERFPILCKSLPAPLGMFGEHLNELNYMDKPDYQLLIDGFTEWLKSKKLSPDSPLDLKLK